MPVLLRPLILLALLAACTAEPPPGHYWAMHTIDDSLSGADGVDLVDIDGDGDADAVVGWEEAGELLLHENPGPQRVRQRWGRTSISGGLEVGKIEDARFADFDGDGITDAVVSATEKGSERVGMHWLLAREHSHRAQSWRGGWLEPGLNYRYLKVAVGQIDGRGDRDIVAGAKTDGKPGALVWYEAPDNGAEDPGAWRGRFIDDIEWIDSISIQDIDGDGRNDILMNHLDNLVWYQNVAAGSLPPSKGPAWKRHLISDTTKSYFADCSAESNRTAGGFLAVGADLSDTEAGGVALYLVGKEITAGEPWRGRWLQREIRALEAIPRDKGERDYHVKGITCGNIDDDERLDIVISMSGRGHGVFALMNVEQRLENQSLHVQVIASEQHNSRKGIKHDNLELIDLDGDGDLDIITTEENGASGFPGRLLPGLTTRGLGLIWFENPLIPAPG